MALVRVVKVLVTHEGRLVDCVLLRPAPLRPSDPIRLRAPSSLGVRIQRGGVYLAGWVLPLPGIPSYPSLTHLECCSLNGVPCSP